MKINLSSNRKTRIKSILFLILGIASSAFTFAQAHEAVIKRPSVIPVVDGIVDQVWAETVAHNIDLPYKMETPSLGTVGQTWWKGFWTIDGIYILVNVADDVFSPAVAGIDSSMLSMYDKVELYIDANYIQKDGMGPAHGKGHYYYAPDPTADMINTGKPGNIFSGGSTYCYKVSDQSYVAEFFIPFSELLDKDGFVLDKSVPFGFDVTVIDNDVKGPVRYRMVWANAGRLDENWNNMDDAGLVTTEGCGCPNETVIKNKDLVQQEKITLYPNPTSGAVRLVFNRMPQKENYLMVNDLNGKIILKQLIQNKVEWINLAGNRPGVYIIKTNLKDSKVQRVILR